jgi:hypothetical protein
MPPISAAATMGVMPPVSNTVEASRLMELSAIMIARASGARGGTWASSKACS